MKKERRNTKRKHLSPLKISALSCLSDMTKIARSGLIIDASTSGFKLHIKREDLIPKALRLNLTLDPLIGSPIRLNIRAMNLEITGVVARTRLLGREGYELAIDFTDDSPEFWRECLLDLLPEPGELEEF